MTRALTLIDEAGPLPAQAGFRTTGSEQMFTVCGSFYSQSGDTSSILKIFVYIDGEEIATLSLAGRHVDFSHIPITKQFVALLPHGSHSIKLSAGPNTHTDTNDTICVTMMES